jgi:hypothetical protein
MTDLGRALFIWCVACFVGWLIAGALIALAWPS